MDPTAVAASVREAWIVFEIRGLGVDVAPHREGMPVETWGLVGRKEVELFRSVDHRVKDVRQIDVVVEGRPAPRPAKEAHKELAGEHVHPGRESDVLAELRCHLEELKEEEALLGFAGLGGIHELRKRGCTRGLQVVRVGLLELVVVDLHPPANVLAARVSARPVCRRTRLRFRGARRDSARPGGSSEPTV